MLLSERPWGPYNCCLVSPKRALSPHWRAQARLPVRSFLQLSTPHFLHFPPLQSQPEFHLHQVLYSNQEASGSVAAENEPGNACTAPQRVENSWLCQMEKRTQEGSTCEIQLSSVHMLSATCFTSCLHKHQHHQELSLPGVLGTGACTVASPTLLVELLTLCEDYALDSYKVPAV